MLDCDARFLSFAREDWGLHAPDQRAWDAQMPRPTAMQATEVRVKAVSTAAGEGP